MSKLILFLVGASILLVTVACSPSSDTNITKSESSTTASSVQDTERETKVKRPITPIQKTQETRSRQGTPKSESESSERSNTLLAPIEQFSGQGSSETDSFEALEPFKLVVKYTGGPININLKSNRDSLRQIFNGPYSSGRSYESSEFDTGLYSVFIECGGDCTWGIQAIVIEGGSRASAIAVPVPDNGSSNTGGANEEYLEMTSTIWDVFSATENALIVSAPNRQAISFSYDPVARQVHVSGFATSVPPNAHVMVANLELGGFVIVAADGDGAFVAYIDGYPGTHIMVKQDITGEIFNVERPETSHGSNILRTIFLPGILIQIPVEQSEHGISFSSAGRLPDDEDAPWTIDGNLSSIRATPGSSVPISGKVAVLSGQQNRPPAAKLRFDASLLVNDVGRQVGGSRIFTTPLFTSTDLPIENKSILESHESLAETQLDWRYDAGRWLSEFSTTLAISDKSDIGLHQLRADLIGVEGLPRKSTQNVLHRSFLQKASIGTLLVGDDVSMRLTPTLLADELSEGSRGGVIAREDLKVFDIVNRAGTRHQPVIPRLDSYGHPWEYRLEPYIPLLGVVDRAPPASPSIKLDFETGNLTVTITGPSGRLDTLGPAPLTSYAVKSPRTPWHTTVSEGGGNIGEIPQLQNGDGVFNYEFPEDGDYVVTLNGQIFDVDGRLYDITGTYDVAVANVLDIEANLLPGTPFEVGNSLPIGLRVMPGLPATIDYEIKHITANGTTTSRTFTGTANENGWWDGDGESFNFKNDGEYRVEIEARHRDREDNLWVGRLLFGSVVATPDAPMILHGRRGPSGISEIAPPWGFSDDFENTDADHIQLPYFAGDVLWGQNHGNLKDSVVILTSIQLLDETHPLLVRAKAAAAQGHSTIPIDKLINAGQMPLEMSTTVRASGASVQPEDIDLWSYVYASVQRPGVRVREHILGDDLGGAYWRFDDAYHMQSGNGRQGDLPGDFKFVYAGAVIRDADANQGLYAIYGSGWVLTTDDDPLGARFMPPFQGAAGGPNGGPLFTSNNREIDMFFHPLGIQPGAILEVGDAFRMTGAIMPTLPSYVEYTVSAPDGSERDFAGRANAIGYFYEPKDDFVLDQSGLWTVQLKVVHDGETSAGPVDTPFPTGGLLTPDGSTFSFVVKDAATLTLDLDTNLSLLAADQWFGNVRSAQFKTIVPSGFEVDKARVIVTMPGTVLIDEDVPLDSDSVIWNLNAEELNQLSDNFDYENGIADTIGVTFYLENSTQEAVGSIVTHGARLPTAPSLKFELIDLPELSSFDSERTDRFIVDLEYVVAGHPYKGQGTKDPDNGAHVNWDNSENLWPEGTAVTDYPAIYAVADGYVSKINNYYQVGENYKYDVNMVFARKDGKPVKLHYAIEPSMNPQDESFYLPYIMVSEGQSVQKGDVLAYMYLQPDDKFPGPHIHFSVQPEGEEQQAPAIFTDNVTQEFYSRWGMFSRDYSGTPTDTDAEIPLCMGYKLAAYENLFGTGAVECLK